MPLQIALALTSKYKKKLPSKQEAKNRRYNHVIVFSQKIIAKKSGYLPKYAIWNHHPIDRCPATMP
jgi:hypothetical protein